MEGDILKLRELADQYRKSAKIVLANPERYGNSEVFQAEILMRRNIEKALTTLARRNDGCISCIHSKPSERDPLNLTARECESGDDNSECKSWKPILTGNQ